MPGSRAILTLDSQTANGGLNPVFFFSHVFDFTPKTLGHKKDVC